MLGVTLLLSILLNNNNIVSVQSFQCAHITSSTSYYYNSDILQLGVQNSNSNEGVDDDDQSMYDITQNLFPEKRRVDKQARSSFPSAFKDGELKDMNDRVPPSPIKPDENTVIKNSAAALYQKIQSQRKKKQSSVAPSAPPKPKKTNPSNQIQKEEDHYDITQSSFPERHRDKSSFQRGQLSEMDSKNPRWNREDDDEGCIDIISQFPKDRPSLSVNTGTQQKERSTSGTYYDEQRRPPPAVVATRNPYIRDDNSYVDINKSFPSDRPSVLVNTGTKTKDGRITTGSYEESKNRLKESSDDAIVGEDESFDITKQHFVGDRQSFISHVNSGSTDRRGANSGQSTATSYEESYRDVVKHNFSSDQASLRGHPKPRKISKLDRAKAKETANMYLNKHRFTDKLSPEPVKALDGYRRTGSANMATKSTTNKLWREGDQSSALDTPRVFTSGKLSPEPVKALDGYRGSGAATTLKTSTNKLWRDRLPIEKDYLDTPRAFTNPDLLPSAVAKGVANESRGTEADKFLDKKDFAWNLDSSRERPPAQTGTQATQNQQYLDTPRVFQSNSIDMKSSNFSGAKFKRSIDIPPEDRNVRDYYDVSTDSMSTVKEMRTSKVKRRGRYSSSNDDGFDITRAPLSNGPLERTSSVIRDANIKGSKVTPTTSQFVATSSPASNARDKEEPSYDDIMYWILTHLPNLQEDDAIAYFHHLLEDGFDDIDILKEQLREEDLLFMKKAHRRALLRSVNETSFDDGDEEEDDEMEINHDKGNNAASQMDEEISDVAAPVQENEDYEDITRSNFVEKRSLFSSSAGDRKMEPVDDELNDEVFDITRNSFTDRPTLSSADVNYDTAQIRENVPIKSKDNVINSRRPLSRESQIQGDTVPPQSTQPSQDDESIEHLVAPRAELYQLYMSKGFANDQAHRLKDYFTVWSKNDSKPHELKFTAVFTCPMTGEHFACGNLKNSGGEVLFEDKTYWYSKSCSF